MTCNDAHDTKSINADSTHCRKLDSIHFHVVVCFLLGTCIELHLSFLTSSHSLSCCLYFRNEKLKTDSFSFRGVSSISTKHTLCECFFWDIQKKWDQRVCASVKIYHYNESLFTKAYSTYAMHTVL